MDIPNSETNILNEAFGFLKQMELSMETGAYALGESVSVYMDVWNNQDKKNVSLLVTCYVFGSFSVDWNRIVLLLSETGKESFYFGFFNSKGQVFFPMVPSGSIHITPYNRFTSKLIITPADTGGDEPVDADFSLAAKGTQALNEPVDYPSVDERIHAVIIPADTHIEVMVYSEHRELEGTVVGFAFIDPDNSTIVEQGRITLLQDQTDSKYVKGSWKKRMETAIPLVFIFSDPEENILKDS
ncbi:MAG: hypothetical protein JXB88_09495 [Spirochaetales bacterium]|nr:hypothetical protein [Spirochaetales bacterium]